MAIFHAIKIDLLLKCKDAKITVEMSSNEWKRASVSMNTQLAQQCKNLVINKAILKNLDMLKTFGIDKATINFSIP